MFLYKFNSKRRASASVVLFRFCCAVRTIKELYSHFKGDHYFASNDDKKIIYIDAFVPGVTILLVISARMRSSRFWDIPWTFVRRVRLRVMLSSGCMFGPRAAPLGAIMIATKGEFECKRDYCRKVCRTKSKLKDHIL